MITLVISFISIAFITFLSSVLIGLILMKVLKLSLALNNDDNYIITQHSGAMHVGSYVRTPVLLIFKGNPPIKGLDDSIRFRKNFFYNEVNIAFNEKEIETFCLAI